MIYALHWQNWPIDVWWLFLEGVTSICRFPPYYVSLAEVCHPPQVEGLSIQEVVMCLENLSNWKMAMNAVKAKHLVSALAKKKSGKTKIKNVIQGYKAQVTA